MQFKPAHYSWELIPFADMAEHEESTFTREDRTGLCQPTGNLICDLPSVLVHNWTPSQGQELLGRHWFGRQTRRPFSSSGARLQLRQCQYFSMLRFFANGQTILEPLFDPRRPLYGDGSTCWWRLPCARQSRQVTGLAVDVLDRVDPLRDGRCVGPELGRVLSSMLKFEMLKLNRLAKHFETACGAHRFCTPMLLLLKSCRRCLQRPR